MEKFIQISAKALAQLRSGFNYFLEEIVPANSTNSILFLLSIFILFLLSFSLILGFPNIAQILIIIAVLAGVMLVILEGLAIYYESNRHLTKGHHNFKTEPINKSHIRFDLIHLNKASQRKTVILDNQAVLIRGSLQFRFKVDYELLFSIKVCLALWDLQAGNQFNLMQRKSFKTIGLILSEFFRNKFFQSFLMVVSPIP